MIRKITPQLVRSYAQTFGVDTILKTKPPVKRQPLALMTTDNKFCRPKLFKLYEYFHLPRYYRGKEYLYVARLESIEHGGGTAAIQMAVRESIRRGNEGRVALHATMLDPDRGHPMPFYYKLGFRSASCVHNKMIEHLLKIEKRNGKEKLKLYLTDTDFMYLPKENVEYCLNYRPSPPKLTYANSTKKPLRRITQAVVDNYKKACGVDSILYTQKPSMKFFDPKADMEYFRIDNFLPDLFTKRLFPKDYIEKPVMHLEMLESFEKGAGTRAIKKVVRESLKDSSEGRVVLRACLLDLGRGNPMGFYYKLGFRSVSERYNKICEEWLKKGGRMEDRPWQIRFGFFAPQFMYLPKENIEHCLHYPEKTLKLAKESL